jgi:hypothetical protein
MSVFQGLKKVVEGSDSPASRVFDLSIGTLIILSLIAFSVETLPGLSPQLLKMPCTALQTYDINRQPMDPGEPGFRLRLWLRRDESLAAFRLTPRPAPSHDAVVWLAKA